MKCSCREEWETCHLVFFDLDVEGLFFVFSQTLLLMDSQRSLGLGRNALT